jgi:hypothetical protein
MKTLRVRAGVLATVTGLVLLGAGITTAIGTASAVPTPGPHKVFVCKYVGQPGVDERLQTGQNPIDVSVNAIQGPVAVGSSFKDAQGRSLVLAFDTGQPDPNVSQCPAPERPTQPTPKVTPSVTPKVTPSVTPSASVLGTSASTTASATTPASVLAANAQATQPLPVSAHAGLADTSGQVIAGSLAAFAALLLLGSGFVLRRRHGVV